MLQTKITCFFAYVFRPTKRTNLNEEILSIIFVLFWEMKFNSTIYTFLKLLFLKLEINSQSQQTMRLSRYVILQNESSEIRQFAIEQFVHATKIRCTQLCFQTLNCLTFTFVAKMCTLYSSDPRIKIDSHVSTVQLSFYGMSQANDKMSCLVDQSELSIRAEIDDKCELGSKIIDSNCSEWNTWTTTYDP